MHTRSVIALVTGSMALVACGGEPHAGAVREAQAAVPNGTPLVVKDTVIMATLEAPGTAEPMAQSTLSTRLMGTVTAVLANEGDAVRAGQPLVRIDARDLAAKREQVLSGIASAEAVQREAALQAARIRSLYADSAAPRAQLDAVEAGLARADAGVRAARAGEAELGVMADYAVVRAPFAGVVTQRLVDPGAFAAPGTPLITVQDQRRLRVAVTIAPSLAGALERGARVDVVIEGVATEGRVEAVVPATAGGMYTVNAIVDNGSARYAAGGAAVLRIPQGTRAAILVPASAVRREGDLEGVQVEAGGRAGVRWVRLGTRYGDKVEVLSGLRAGETIRVPSGASQE